MAEKLDLGSILRSFDYFFDKVLLAAQNEGDWSVKSFEEGIGWALFCETAARQPEYEYEIMKYLSTKPYNKNYEMKDLQNLRAILISNLFLNQLLSKDLFNSLYLISERELGEIATKVIIATSVKNIDCLRKAFSAFNDKKFERINRIVRIRLFIDAASLPTFSSSILNDLLMTGVEFKMILEMAEKLNDLEKNKMYECLGEWIMNELENKNVQILHQFAYLSVAQIEFLCYKFAGLHSKMMLFIYDLGNKLSKVNAKENKDFDVIVTLCSAFMKCANLRNPTEEAFASFFTSTEAYFWHPIYCKLVQNDALNVK